MLEKNEPKISQAQYQPEPSPVKSEFSNLNNLHLVEQEQQQVKYNYNNKINSVSDALENKEKQEKKQMNSDVCNSKGENPPNKSFSDLQKFPKSSKARVRISSVVENIETHEHYEISNSSVKLENEEDLSENESSSQPYELTRPIKLPINNASDFKINERPNSSDIPKINHNRPQPKIMNRQSFASGDKAESSPTSFISLSNNHASSSSSKSSSLSSSENNKNEDNAQNVIK